MRYLAYKCCQALRFDETGQDLFEYALLVALISVVVAGALAVLGGQITGLIEGSVKSISEAVGLAL